MSNQNEYILKLNNVISNSPISSLPHNILKFFIETTNADNIRYLVYDKREQRLNVQCKIYKNKHQRTQKSFSIYEGLVGYCAKSLQPVFADNIKSDEKYSAIYNEIDPKVQSEYCIPLEIDKKLFAILDLEFYSINGLSTEFRKQLNAIAYQALIALKYCEKNSKTKVVLSKNRNLSTLFYNIYDVDFYDQQISEIIEARLLHIRKIIPYSFASFWHYNEKNRFGDLQFDESLTLVSSVNSKGYFLVEGERTFAPLKDTIFEKTIIQKKIKRYENLKKDIRIREKQFIKEFNLNYLISIPLLKEINGKNELMGVLNFYFKRYTAVESTLLKLSATLILTALERIIQTKKEKIMDLLIERPEKTIDEHIDRAIKIIQEFGSEAVSVFLSDKNSDSLTLFKTTGIEQQSLTDGKVMYVYGEGITGRVAKFKSPIIINNLRGKEVKQLHKAKWREKTINPKTSFIGCPIANDENEILGVIRCVNKLNPHISTQVESYSQVDLKLISHVAKILALHIQNHRMAVIKDDLLSRIPHDLKSPILGIRNTATLLSKFRMSNTRIQQHLENITQECELMFLLVNRIRTKREYNFQQTHLMGDVIIKIVKMLSPFANERNISIDYNNLKKIPYILYLDKELIQILMYDLIINAIKYSYDGTDIEITARELGKFILIEIKNFGIGISQKEAEKIFMPEYRTEEAIKCANGTGWGLSISREIARNHGGEIRVSSLNMPTILSLELPNKLIYGGPDDIIY